VTKLVSEYDFAEASALLALVVASVAAVEIASFLAVVIVAVLFEILVSAVETLVAKESTLEEVANPEVPIVRVESKPVKVIVPSPTTVMAFEVGV
jgi:hypothetical protein